MGVHTKRCVHTRARCTSGRTASIGLARALLLLGGMTSPAVDLADKRRSEIDAAVRHRALVIHASVGGPSGGAVSPPLRQAVRQQAEATGLADKVVRRLIDLLSSLEALDAHKAVLQLTRHPNFVQLKVEHQDLLLARLAKREPNAAQISKVEVCLREAGITKLDPSAVRIAVVAMTSQDMLVVRHLPELLACAGLALLTPAEQRDVLGYYVGPRLARGIAPMRRNRMRLMWNAKRQDLLTRLRAPAFRRAPPRTQADTVQAFLREAKQPLHVLNATSLNGHAVIIFGAPDDRRALSYGRRWVAARGGGWPQPRLYAPDPSVNSGWSKPAMDGRTPYSGLRYRLSRLEMWRLIGWIETSFVISDDQRATGLGPGHLGGDAKTFVEDFEKTLRNILSDARRTKGSPGCFLAGRPHDPSAGEDTPANVRV